MRLWSLHPRYLDQKGLVAAWREALLAQAVLAGRTRGYRSHPQLERFRSAGDPQALIGFFLLQLWLEAGIRGYSFDRSRIDAVPAAPPAPVRVGALQLRYEAELLLSKLGRRDPSAIDALLGDVRVDRIETNPAFAVASGGIEPWERVLPEIGARIPVAQRRPGGGQT